jgi:phosphotriesterase-related protein
MTKIITVTGEISTEEMGFCLPHEHIMTDFIGAEKTGNHRYDREEVIQVMLPYLKEIKDLGVQTFIECTPKYVGRDVEILKELAERSSLHIVTNTGQYARENLLPQETYEISAETLAEKWIKEFEQGIEGTSIKPGFIKTAVEGGSLREIEKKTLQAASITSNATGMTIGTHTADGKTALEILDLLSKHEVPADKWIFIHAHVEDDFLRVLEVAKRGAWIELDGLAWESERAKHLDYTKQLIAKGFTKQLLLSHDAGWYHIGEENGGEQIPFTNLIEEFIPKLKNYDVDDKTINLLTRENPAHAFSIQ